jgi:glycosyltransferase involved in cell wall biosynthesis
MDTKKLLMVAFHFPPMKGSSGLQRSLAFSRYLAEDYAWRPLVLTATRCAYRSVSNDQMDDIHEHVKVFRALGLDAAKHFAIAGRYPRRLAIPDPWANWWLSGVVVGLRIIRQFKPSAIWSTFPIATSHRIAYTLHRLSGLPWIADFRDSMTEQGYPSSEDVWRSFREIEQKTVRSASALVFTAPGCIEMYQSRYPEIDKGKFSLIENGYDERDFEFLKQPEKRGDGILRLVHSGLLYREERDPTAFFRAIARLKSSGCICGDEVNVVLRASGDEDYYRAILRQMEIDDVVVLEPALPYREALQEMVDADGLLVFQSANCNHQIPAKLYEYLRASRPILALTDPRGDTASVVRRREDCLVVPIDDQESIQTALVKLMSLARLSSATAAPDAESHTRRARTGQLVKILEQLS